MSYSNLGQTWTINSSLNPSSWFPVFGTKTIPCTGDYSETYCSSCQSAQNYATNPMEYTQGQYGLPSNEGVAISRTAYNKAVRNMHNFKW